MTSSSLNVPEQVGIDTMTAGRQMDILIAQEVFGETLPSDDTPPYSTNEDVSFRVVSRMRALQWEGTLLTGGVGRDYTQIFRPLQAGGDTSPQGRRIEYRGMSDSLALAICRAALNAMRAPRLEAPSTPPIP